MKTVVLCGGLGTRLAEETTLRPKPMVDVGGRPILWHILKLYAHYNHSDFVLALGYKAEFIKQYFLHYHLLNSNFSVRLKDGQTEVFERSGPDWNVNLIDTGERTMTGGRLLRLKRFLENESTFMLTYGDGVADVDIAEVVRFHRSHGKIATVTAVRPTARFGGLQMHSNQVVAFDEKPQLGEGWINGGFFVFERAIFDYLEDDQTILERAPMEGLVQDGQLMSYQHNGFWQCMDTRREKELLDQLWAEGRAPWKVWGDE
jgi:glucose-1-phosphate cytidylyltransferase